MADKSRDDETTGSAVDSAVGGLLSWVTGKESTRRTNSPTDGAVGEILSWVTGTSRRRQLRNSVSPERHR
ncbi:hypothetical protein [Williamsia sp. M5A3_1d]